MPLRSRYTRNWGFDRKCCIRSSVSLRICSQGETGLIAALAFVAGLNSTSRPAVSTSLIATLVPPRCPAGATAPCHELLRHQDVFCEIVSAPLPCPPPEQYQISCAFRHDGEFKYASSSLILTIAASNFGAAAKIMSDVLSKSRTSLWRMPARASSPLPRHASDH